MRTETTTIDRKINISKSSNHFNDSEVLKYVGQDGAFSSKTNQERSVHRQLKTFYGQINAAATNQHSMNLNSRDKGHINTSS